MAAIAGSMSIKYTLSITTAVDTPRRPVETHHTGRFFLIVILFRGKEIWTIKHVIITYYQLHGRI